jgi:hypothetical protein
LSVATQLLVIPPGPYIFIPKSLLQKQNFKN